MIHIIAAAVASSQESKEKSSTMEEDLKDLKDFAIEATILLVFFFVAAGAAYLFTVGVEWFDNFTMTHNAAFDPNTLTQSIKELFK